MWPWFPEALSNLGRLQQMLGDADHAAAAYDAALKLRPDLHEAQHNALVCRLCMETCSPEDAAEAHREWGRQFLPLPPAPRRRAGAGPIRIGYVSGGVREGPQYFFLTPMFRAHDREQFRVFCYSNWPAPDAYTRRAQRLVDSWRDISRLDDAQAAARIRADGIDLLIDAGGHFSDGRLELFAHRPAPVQVSLSQYPATTGMPAIAFRTTGRVADPPGLTDHLYVERLVRLKRGFAHCCYAPPAGAPEVAPLPALRGRGVTFGSFNKLSKIGLGTIGLWAGILRRVADSRLLIHHVFEGRREVSQTVRRPFEDAFAERGVQPGRIRFVGWRPLEEHLELFSKVDILLDPFPYAGMTTTCESLWMGVPVVTLAGHSHHCRVGASLLSAAGLPGWIAETSEDYTRIAVQAAGDLQALAGVRAGLRRQVQRSPLTDESGFTQALERALLRVWNRSPAGRS